MPLIDYRWPWMAACWLVFLAMMSAFNFWRLNVDYLAGLRTGASRTAAAIFTVVGWRRGEMRRPGSPYKRDAA
jgi:hypothetical protein